MDNHLGAGVEIIQRDKRVQVGEQLLHSRSNFLHGRSNVARIPLLLTRAHISGHRCMLTPPSKPHTSISHVAGDTGVRRTIFLFGILLPIASHTARCKASSTGLVNAASTVMTAWLRASLRTHQP